MTKPGKLIGLVGYAGSGKTTVTAEAIIYLGEKIWPSSVVQTNFSRPIVNMLAAMGIPREILNDKSRWNESLDILCGHSTRYAAQTLGTEWGRDHIGVDVWTRIAMEEANKLRSNGMHVIIDNVRFPSEADAIRENDGVLISFMRPGLEINTDHESEQHIANLQRQTHGGFMNVQSFNASVDLWRKYLIRLIDN